MEFQDKKNIYLFYGVYDLKQLTNKNLNLIPYIFDNKYPWKREIQIFKNLYNLILNSEINHESIYGLFSSSLSERISLDCNTLINTIKKSDKDIFIFSPSQYNFFIYYNFWDQAELWHEGIIEEIVKIYSLKSDFPKIDTSSRSKQKEFSYCNFWAAKRHVFLKLVREMLILENLMLDNNLGNKETYWESPVKQGFNEIYKKNYKLFPFIIERYLSSFLLDSEKISDLDIFYWEDKRHPIDQIEKINGLNEVLKNPVNRGYDFYLKKIIFQNKKDFYNKIWFSEDYEKLDKVIPGSGKRLYEISNS